jgi:Tfp pilus assembly protein FimT
MNVYSKLKNRRDALKKMKFTPFTLIELIVCFMIIAIIGIIIIGIIALVVFLLFIKNNGLKETGDRIYYGPDKTEEVTTDSAEQE